MFSFLRLLALLCLIAGALLQSGGVRAYVPDAQSFETKFNSVSEACHGVLETECPSDGRSRSDCLMERTVDNASHECKMWLSWRATCFAYAMVYLIPHGRCNFTSDQATSELIRNCIRHTDRKELPAACGASPYYNALTLHAQRLMDSDAAADL